MNNDFYGTAIKKPIPVKWYDLTKCPRDDDGDYLDENGGKLTFTGYKDDLHGAVHKIDTGNCSIAKYVNTLENKHDEIHQDGFILVGVKGEKWCIRRDIFLETYHIEE